MRVYTLDRLKRNYCERKFCETREKERLVRHQSPTRPKKFTVHRQRQLVDIFNLYGGKKIPFNHFGRELVRNSNKRDRLAFPAVFGYLFGILKIDGDGLVKPNDLILAKDNSFLMRRSGCNGR